MPEEKSMNSNLLVVLAVIGIVAIGLLAMGLKDTSITIMEGEDRHTLSVQGSVQMTVAPDKASVSVGMSYVGATAIEAQSNVNEAISAILAAFEEMGMTMDDIETSNLSVYEERWWNEGEPKSLGWRATQTLTVTTMDVEDVGAIIDAAIDNGANEVQGVTFMLSDEARADLMQDALGGAGAAAKEKAEAIAEGLGVSLGDIKEIVDTTSYYVPYDVRPEYSADEKINTPTVVVPGDVSITATISVVYLIE
jgi:uncharacterized protein YggE